MKLRLIFRAIPVLISSVAAPALACQSYVGPMNLDFGTRAEIIVIGRITDYENVKNTMGLRSGATIPLSAYSRIFITVEQVLAGHADKTISAIVSKWPSGGLGATAPSGQVLIALEDLSVSGGMRPRGGRDGAVIPNPRWGHLTVVEEPCRSAFIFDAASDEARAFLAKWRHANTSGHSRRKAPQANSSPSPNQR